MEPSDLKTEAHRLVDRLPDDATRDDLMCRLYVRQAVEAVEAGLADSEAGRTVEVGELRLRLRVV